MKLNSVVYIGVMGLAVLALPSCQPSGHTHTHSQNVSAEMTAYASAVIDEFYDYDLEAGTGRSKDTLSIDVLESFADNAHETAAPANKVKQGHHFSQDSGVNLVALEYAIPNAVGQETATVTLSYDNDVCCQLMRFDLK